MCRKLALLATVLTLAGAPALAATAASPASPAKASKASPTPPAPRKVTAEERLEAERLDPLGRAAFWSRVMEADPRDTDAAIKLAKALRALGRFDDAGAAVDQVLVVEPNNLEALLESARAKIAANQGFYAIDLVQRAASLAPRDWRPQALLAVALEQADRDDEALSAHQKALAMAPNNPATLTNLGMFYATHGDPQSAEPLLRKAVAAPGAGAQERQNLALILGMEGRLDEAERLARQDLPPDVVSNNLDYLHAAINPAPARSWESVKTAQ
ncbi:MAG: tetratricopeptide repeat protein [Caulobacterales bacterium]